MAETPLWTPSPERIEEANLTRFARQAIRDWKLGLNDYPAFYRWTTEHPEQFGDRVAAYLPNLPEAIAAMLAATSIGATFSTCSPDFGVEGVLDRFGQIAPAVLFAADGYHYNGKQIDSLQKVREIAARLPSLKRVVVVPYVSVGPDVSAISGAQRLEDFVADRPASDIPFEQLPFDHPLYILFSSGTTGVPKCIVHGAGGALLKHLCEQQLHCDVGPGDRLFYFTTLGWMMWNWLASALASGATLLLYDGSPFVRNGNILFDYADAERITHLEIGRASCRERG